ncbi:hypothetical protein LO763_19310 [Glycomyces sp. A-F 0318]|uniref:hypothetical protein n=1 Tax=Glycomyces amatae TaxID=2881355 RepID=UPI001E30FF99|nr:hypothetical protein [Glycomyces amatae]MCD0445760.1 hypothetical protein [Glycomyces amatae]
MTSETPVPLFRTSQPERSRGSDATAHLCAAAYLDPDFRLQVIEQVYARRDRAVAPNPGADAVPVLRHVRRATVIDTAEQGVLALMLVSLLTAPTVNNLTLVIGLSAWLLVGLKLRKIGNDLKISSNQRRIESNKILRWATARLTVRRAGVIAVGLLLFLWVDFHTAGTPIWTWLAMLGATCTGFELARMYCLSRIPEGIASRSRARKRAGAIGSGQRSSLIVRPRDRVDRHFPGFGKSLGSIPFSMPLRPAAASVETTAFTVADLHRHLKQRITALSEDSTATRGLPDLEVDEQWFVSDRFVTAPVTRLVDLPEGLRPEEGWDALPDIPDSPVRQYLRCQVSTQGGETVGTCFAYFALQGETLYMRLSRCALPATREDYHVFRGGALNLRRAMAWAGVLALATAPIEVLRSPYDAALTAWRGLKHGLSGRPALRGWRHPDCGALTGVRELGYDGDAEHLDLSEAYQYVLVVQQQILEALKDFLTGHGIDIRTLDDHMTAIVNYGVINNGEMTAGAVGTGAQATSGAIGTGSSGAVHQQAGRG